MPAYHCNAIAATDAVVRFYPKAVMDALQREPGIAKAFAAMLARQLTTLRKRLQWCNIHSTRERVRHYLTVNARADRRTAVLAGTLKDLAAELGLTPEALYRTLDSMHAEGEITRAGSVITLAQRK